MAVLALVVGVYLCNICRFLILPQVSRLAAQPPESTAFMEYRAAQWRQSGSDKTPRQTWKPLSAISPHLQKAVVVSEDSTFWRHRGFDMDGIRDALRRNLARRELSAGGSTITQQLAKNLYFSPEKSLTRKLQEAAVAHRLERSLTKERILELYLNYAEWGDGIFGAEAAARYYFNVSASRLTPYQAATLAAMLPSPLTRKPGSPLVRRLASTIMARMKIA